MKTNPLFLPRLGGKLSMTKNKVYGPRGLKQVMIKPAEFHNNLPTYFNINFLNVLKLETIMKNYIRVFVFLYCLLNIAVNNVSAQNYEKGIQGYFRIGTALPIGTLNDDPDPALSRWWTNENSAFKGDLVASGGGAKTGFTLEGGTIIPLSQTGEYTYIQLVTGINYTRMDFDWTNTYPSYWEEMVSMVTQPINHFGFSVGPMFTFEPTADFAVSASYQLHPSLLSGGTWEHRYSIGGTDYWMDRLEFNSGFGIKHTLSVETRFKFLSLAFSADLGRVNFKKANFFSYALDSRRDSTPSEFLNEEFSTDPAYSMLKVTLGVIFGN